MTTYQHPSYGVAQISRLSCSGKRRLFGSALDIHHTVMVLRVQTGRLMREDGKPDAVYADSSIVEVWLSAAQFAELLTSSQLGDGVPCTIMRRGAMEVEEPPAIGSEGDHVREHLRSELAAVDKHVTKTAAEIMDMLPSTVKPKDRRKIEVALEQMGRHIVDHVPHALRSFQEATERTVVAAKGEIDAFVAHVAQATGIQAIRRMMSGAQAPALPETTEDQ